MLLFPLQSGGSGRLGYGNYASGSEQRAPVLVVDGHKFADISGGAEHTCAITLDGVAWCWGPAPENGQDSLSNAPKRISGGHTFTAISSGFRTCALDTASDIWCWGEPGRGVLGHTNPPFI